MPPMAETALAVTRSDRSTVPGSAAPLAASTKRDVDSSSRMPTNAPASDRVTTVASAARVKAARTKDMTTSTRRRDQRSIRTPVKGPTRLNGSSVTASTAASRAGVAPRPASKTTNWAKAI